MQQNLLGRLMLDLDSISLTEEERYILQNPHVGGIILFSRNIVSKNQVLSLCQQIIEINPNLLIAVDQEGGRVQRLIDGYAILPAMQKLAECVAKDNNNDLMLATNLGWLMASEVIASGLDFSFAPVLDLDLKTSSIIGDRSFGDNPETVINIAHSFIKGMNEAGMQAIGKHFPGHGGIHADTHLVCSEDPRPLAELERHLISCIAN
jgi:beta-N-acetylhexosaminidase